MSITVSNPYNDLPIEQPQNQQKAPTDAPPWYSAIQGMGDILPAMMYGGEKSLGNMAQAGASLTGFQPLQDISNQLDLDAEGKRPNLEGRPVRQFNWNVASGLPIMGASMLTTLATDNPVLGAAVQAPDIMGGTVKDVTKRGGTPQQALTSGLEAGAVGTAAMSLPMHQLMQGGTLLTRVLKNAAVNAGVGGGLSVGQEEIEKANNVKPLPDGSEFNNAIYASLMGGVTGGILGVLTPAEKAINADKVADIVLSDQVKQGILTTQQAQGARQELIKNIQDLAIRTRMKGGNTVENMQDIINSPNPNEEVIKNGKFFVYDQGDGGTTKEVENVLPSTDSETWKAATRIVNQAFTEARTDAKGKIIRDKDGQPIADKTQTDKMPIEYQHALYNDIITRLRNGDDKINVLDDVMQKRLPSQQPNVIYAVGGARGRDENTNIFSPTAGVQSITGIAAASVKAGVDPSTLKIYHAGEAKDGQEMHGIYATEVEKIKTVAENLASQLPIPTEPAVPSLSTPETGALQTSEAQPEAASPMAGLPVEPMIPEPAINPQEQTEAIKEHLDALQEEKERLLESTMTDHAYMELPNNGVAEGMKNAQLEEVLGTDKDTERTDGKPPEHVINDSHEANEYKKEIIRDVMAGRPVQEFTITKEGLELKGFDIKTNGESTITNNDGKFKLIRYDDGSKYVELKGVFKHLSVLISDYNKFIASNRDPIEAGEPSGFTLQDYSPLARDVAAKGTKSQKAIYDAMENKDFLSNEEREKLASGFVDLSKELPKAIHGDFNSKLSSGMGEDLKINELESDIDTSNIRSFPMKIGFKIAQMTGNRENFLKMMQAYLGKTEFAATFKTAKPAGVDHQIIQGLMEDKRLVDLVQFMATDNLRPAMKVLWQVAAEKAGEGAKRADIQKVYSMYDSLMSRAAEEITSLEGNPKKYSKSFIGMGEKEFSRSGQPGTPDEWRDRNHFIADYTQFLKAFGKPLPPTMEGRPELAFFNLLKEAGGDRTINLLLWTKAELEHASFSEMLKAGVFSNNGISANMFHGYSPRSWEYKGLQKEYASSRNPAGSPANKSASVPEREALNYSDFVGRAKGLQGLEVNESYLSSMHEYITGSLLKASQYRTLNWLRSFVIPDSKLRLTGYESHPEVKEVVKNLKYVEYKNSENITKLSNLTGRKPNDILQDLGYIQDKKREGLISWDKFSFEPPYLQASLSDVLDSVYPQTWLQTSTVSGLTRALNIPKRILTLSPFQHTLLFASSVLANSGYRVPVVLGKYLLTGGRVMANAPFAAHAAFVKGEAQTHDIFGHPIEQDYRGMENLPMFIKDGFGTGWSSLAPGLFEESKLTKYFIPEMMTPQQVSREARQSVLNMNRIMFDQFLTREIYAVTNARYEQFRKMTGTDGQRLMMDAEASRRAVTLINSTSGVVHQASFGKNGPLWSLFTFARGLTIAPLRVISGAVEPTLRRIYGQKASERYKIDGFSGLLNPITMGDVSPKDADFLQAYYAQHIAKTIGLRIIAMGVVQYALSFLDDDKKDEYGQQGADLMNSKRFLWNNPAGSRMSIRTPWTDINGRRIMLDPTYLRESKVLIDSMGLGTRYQFPASTLNWIESRMNMWQDLIFGAIYGVDPRTGVKFADKDTDEYAHEVQQWMMAKVMPLSMGITQEEKEQRIANPRAEAAVRLSAVFGSTPKTAPLGWSPSYEATMKADKEFKTQQEKEREDLSTMSAQDLLNKKLSVYFSQKAKENAYLKKTNPQAWVQRTMGKAAQEFNIFGKVPEEELGFKPENPKGSEDQQRQEAMSAQLVGGL